MYCAVPTYLGSKTVYRFDVGTTPKLRTLIVGGRITGQQLNWIEFDHVVTCIYWNYSIQDAQTGDQLYSVPSL